MKTITNTTKTETSQGSYPSADLINFRFDQNDEAMARLDSKLDNLLNQSVTPKDLADAKAECAVEHKGLAVRLAKLEKLSDRIIWLVLSTVIMAVLVSVGIKDFLIK